MQVLSGLFDHMVIQRNRRDVTDIAVAGAGGSEGSVQVRVRAGGRAVRGFNWVKIGQAVGKKFTARLKGLAVGGPYDIGLRIVDRSGKVVAEASVRDVLVGDVWLLAGQSNMEGCGTLARHPKADRDIRAFYAKEQWGRAQHPLHRFDPGHDPEDPSFAGDTSGVIAVGPGLAFARTMKARTGVPQGLIPCAQGGTSMQQWDPARKTLPSLGLYHAAIRMAKMNGGRVAGVLWYQGCSDAIGRETRKYTARMEKLIGAFRRDLGDSRLPVVAVQIARYAEGELVLQAPWNEIQEQQRLLPATIERLVVVPTIDLGLEDIIHLDGPGQQRLGGRLAQAMLALTQQPRQEKLPIELTRIRLRRQPISREAIIEIDFKNVAGQLTSPGRAAGFALSVDGERALSAICRTQVRSSRIVIHTSIDYYDIAGYKLSYGLGVDPYCNVVDEADRSLPVFGPVQLGTPRAITPFIRDWRISDVLPSAGKLHKLTRPDTAEKALGWRSNCYQPVLATLADRLGELQALAPQDNLVLYACCFDCAEKMPLSLWLGYDGPVKVWVGRKMVFHDPNGTNPVEADAARIDFKAGKGPHEVVVALGSNGGLASGIFLRVERTDISARLLGKGPDAYVMPRILG